MGPLCDQEEEEMMKMEEGDPEGRAQHPPFALRNPQKIRKYLVLLQDSLAIKFVPLVSPSHPYPLAFNQRSGPSTVNSGKCRASASSGGSGGRPQGSSLGPQVLTSEFKSALETATTEVDHSLHALYLYKSFRESNLECYWNVALSETFRNLQYKGYIVPSTLLVSALPRFLTILRTAWSRQMLRSPAGYRIEFIGEIEELIAEPMGQGQFAPLSDSLCWAIFELTSIGEEAFVDSILITLKTSFPLMSCPTRELVYQTLEKLIRERKIYQTARGYFVVTPDTLRFMTSADPSLGAHSFQQPQPIFTQSHPFTLDALFTNHNNISNRIANHFYESEKMSFSREPWDYATNNCPEDDPRGHNDDRHSNNHDDLISDSRTLKRHNSLKTFRQKDIAAMQKGGEGLGQRSSSMRLSKSKSCGRMDEEEEVLTISKGSKSRRSTLSHITNIMMKNLKMGGGAEGTLINSSTSTKVNLDKNQKGKSLFRKIFGRSGSKSREIKSSPNSGISSPEVERSSRITMASQETQTSLSSEQLASAESPSLPPTTNNHLTNSNNIFAKSSKKFANSSTSTASDGARHLLHSDQDKLEERDGGLSSERSTDSPVYDVLHEPRLAGGSGSGHPNNYHSNHHQPHPLVGSVPPNFPAFHHREQSSRCSTLSQATSSLGYGSQGYPSLNLSSGSYNNYHNCNSSSHSPCPYDLGGVGGGGPSPPASSLNHGEGLSEPLTQTSLKPPAFNILSSKDKGPQISTSQAEFYRRRYPSYTSSFSRASPQYSSLNSPKNKVKRGSNNYEPLLTTANSNSNRSSRPEVPSGNRSKGSKGPTAPSSNTTTVTQNMKSTTNMELELLLPLGNIMKAALNAKKKQLKDEFFRKEFNREPPPQEGEEGEEEIGNSGKIPINLENSGVKLRVGEPTSHTEIKTTVDKDGLIETHFESHPGVDLSNLKSKVEIKFNGDNNVEVSKSTSKISKNNQNDDNSSRNNKKCSSGMTISQNMSSREPHHVRI